VIDVVEGSAMDALPFMEDIVSKRPTHFKDLQSVVKYGVTSQTVRCLESAKVSMPPQVRQETKDDGSTQYVWRTDLMASKDHWVGWFKDLTADFLGLRMPKILLLAGSDRMDKELTIAHMMGKFRMVVLNDVGHVVHEDDPDKTAASFRDFIETFKWPTDYQREVVITSMSGKKVVINP
jgi:pimeloyl-ACP methyl ester carboxylesterase